MQRSVERIDGEVGSNGLMPEFEAVLNCLKAVETEDKGSMKSMKMKRRMR
jgi:hypothetical protein